MPKLPDFLPASAPSYPILDLSHQLTSASSTEITNLVKDCSYTPTVVILPSDYRSPDSTQLAKDIAANWGIDGAGKKVLLLIDLQGHTVRVHGSPEMNELGTTSNYISNTLVPRLFVPHMKQGNLSEAIKSTLLGIESSSTSRSTTSTSSVATTAMDLGNSSLAPPAVPIWQNGGILFPVLMVGVVIAVVIRHFTSATSSGPRDPVKPGLSPAGGSLWDARTGRYRGESVRVNNKSSGKKAWYDSDSSTYDSGGSFSSDSSSSSDSGGSSDGGGSW
jgi:uncharacterized membrane protein YgcG